MYQPKIAFATTETPFATSPATQHSNTRVYYHYSPQPFSGQSTQAPDYGSSTAGKCVGGAPLAFLSSSFVVDVDNSEGANCDGGGGCC